MIPFGIAFFVLGVYLTFRATTNWGVVVAFTFCFTGAILLLLGGH